MYKLWIFNVTCSQHYHNRICIMNPSSHIITFTTSTLFVGLLLYVWYFCLYLLCNGVLSCKYIPPLTAESYSFGCSCYLEHNIHSLYDMCVYVINCQVWYTFCKLRNDAVGNNVVHVSCAKLCSITLCIRTARPDCQQLREPDAAATITAAVPLQELQSTD